MPFSQFINYLQLEKNYSRHTLTAYQKDLANFSDFIKNEFQLDEISTVNYAMIRSWLVLLAEQGLSNSSINRKIASLKSYYKYLQKIGERKVSPLQKHKSLKVSKKVQVPFSEKEMTEVISLFTDDDFESIRNKLIVELLYSTGMRRAELINLKLANVNLSANTIKILGKRNKERVLPLLPSVVITLNQYIEERKQLPSIKDKDFLILTQKGVKIYETLVYRLVNSYFSGVSAKVKRSPHIIRHSFATHLLNEGANLNAVKELLGHASLASTQVYTHNDVARLSKVYAGAHPRSNKS